MKKTIKFTDKAISNLRHADYEFTYLTKDGATKTRKQIEITFEDLRHTRLKGLKIRIFRNGGLHFGLSYWFNGESKRVPLGEYLPGVFGSVISGSFIQWPLSFRCVFVSSIILSSTCFLPNTPGRYSPKGTRLDSPLNQ